MCKSARSNYDKSINIDFNELVPNEIETPTPIRVSIDSSYFKIESKSPPLLEKGTGMSGVITDFIEQTEYSLEHSKSH